MLRRALVLLVALLIVLAGQLWLLWQTHHGGVVQQAFGLAATGWPGWGFHWAQVGLVAVVAVLVWRAILVVTYRPVESVADPALPAVTVVVPAYNEGRQVFWAIQSIVASNYPAERLQVIALNDGSADDTWSWIRLAADSWPQVVAINHLVNRGKRAMLYEGFCRASGDVLVTVDSDSEVLPDALRNLVSPMVIDRQVGGVAGAIRVLKSEGDGAAPAIPAMLDVTFTHAFEFDRASQSQVGTVMCGPGALSAYRRDLVDAVKGEWLMQTFCGRPASIGEDRALTNLILRSGYLMRFQSNAVARTAVPETLPQLSKMFLRWARSNVRETLVMGGFIFKRFRVASATGARVNFVCSVLRILLAVPLFVLLVLLPFTSVGIVAAVWLAWLSAAGLAAAVFLVARPTERGAWWAFPYAVFSALCLSWITPYALLTPHHAGWLTRQATPRRTATAGRPWSPRSAPSPSATSR